MKRRPGFLPWFCLAGSLALAPAIDAGLRVTVAGNHVLHSRGLEEMIGPELEDSSSEGLRAWSGDAEFAVIDAYRAVGCFDAQVHVSIARDTGHKGDWAVHMQVDEGARYLFDTARVLPTPRPDAPVDSAALGRVQAHPLGSAAVPPLPSIGFELKELEVQPGRPYRDESLLKDRRLLLRRFGNAGYVRAEVQDGEDIRPASHTVRVTYYVSPSYPVVFDTLILKNVRSTPGEVFSGITREGIVRSLIPYKRGDTVRMSDNDKLISKLQYTGVFNYVRFKDTLQSGAEGRSALTLYSEERVPGNLRTSLFYETQYGPGVSLDARHGNIAGTLKEVRGGSSLAGSRQNFYLGYGSPLNFGQLVRFDDDLGFNWYQDKLYLASQGPFGGDFRSTNSTRLTFPLTYWLRLVGDAELEVKSLMPGGGQRERDFNLNFIETAFLTFVNQAMDPTRGLRFAFTWGNGGPLLSANQFDITEFRHNWFEAQTAQYYFLPSLRQIKLATRLDGGRFFGVGGSNSERFFLGGSRNVRSFDFQALCTEKSPKGACLGDDHELAYGLASAEVRVEPFAFGRIGPRNPLRYFVPLQIVPFLDVGKVWDVRDGFYLKSAGGIDSAGTGSSGSIPAGQGYAYGLGMRYPLLGIFNLRIDYVRGNGPHHFWLDLAQAF